jgi:hypothetical protein
MITPCLYLTFPDGRFNLSQTSHAVALDPFRSTRDQILFLFARKNFFHFNERIGNIASDG